MNRKGKTSPALMLLIVGVIAVVAILGYAAFYNKPQISVGGGDDTSGGINILTGSTALTLNAQDATSPGTTVAGTTQYSTRGGAYKSGTLSLTVSPKDQLAILVVNNTQYHNAVVPSYTVANSPTDILDVKLAKNASITFRAFNTAGNQMDLTTTPSVNQTALTAGQSGTLDIKIDGQDKASSNDMRCVVESSSGALNTTSAKLSGFPGLVDNGASKKPAAYSQAANSALWTYDIGAVTGAGTVNGQLYIQAASAKVLSAAQTVKIVCYTKEWFLDTNDGKVKYDVEDSLGALKSMATYTNTITFQ